MLSENKKELDSLMHRYSEDLTGLKAQKEQVKAAQDASATAFEKLKHEVIWPIIIDVGNQLNQYGHDYHVDEAEEYVDATAHFQPANITLNIYPARLDRSNYKPECTPYISFVENRYAQKVGIVVSTMMPSEGGVIGSHGEYTLDQLTAEFVEKEIIEVLKNTLIFHQE